MAKRKRNILPSELEGFRRDQGLTQTELAAKLGISQPHLSRVLSGTVTPGDKLTFRLNRLLGRKPESGAVDPWLERVKTASARSTSFKELVESALDILRIR